MWQPAFNKKERKETFYLQSLKATLERTLSEWKSATKNEQKIMLENLNNAYADVKKIKSSPYALIANQDLIDAFKIQRYLLGYDYGLREKPLEITKSYALKRSLQTLYQLCELTDPQLSLFKGALNLFLHTIICALTKDKWNKKSYVTNVRKQLNELSTTNNKKCNNLIEELREICEEYTPSTLTKVAVFFGYKQSRINFETFLEKLCEFKENNTEQAATVTNHQI